MTVEMPPQPGRVRGRDTEGRNFDAVESYDRRAVLGEGRKGQSARCLLGVAGGSCPRWLWGLPSWGDEGFRACPSVFLGDGLRPDPGRAVCSSPLRQPPMRTPRSSIPGNEARQHAGHGAEGPSGLGAQAGSLAQGRECEYRQACAVPSPRDSHPSRPWRGRRAPCQGVWHYTAELLVLTPQRELGAYRLIVHLSELEIRRRVGNSSPSSTWLREGTGR